jgi:hypothetical protein
MTLAKAMTSKIYKRGVVVMTADYYDPVALIEMVRSAASRRPLRHSSPIMSSRRRMSSNR